jgi:hypothetical protein
MMVAAATVVRSVGFDERVQTMPDNGRQAVGEEQNEDDQTLGHSRGNPVRGSHAQFA